MLRMWAGLAAVLLLGAAASSAAQAQQNQGQSARPGATSPQAPKSQASASTVTWNGQYSYSGGRSPVEFVLELDMSAGRCAGTIEEPNTFGDKSSKVLRANVSCVASEMRPGSVFRFHKQYDGTGGVGHGVEYSGVVAESGLTVSGQWRIGGTSGQFSMTRRIGQ